MSLAPGTRLGPYEITSPLGAGGMGEVYRARDSRLGRDVAVKVLPGSLANDPDRLRRFEQEARSASLLNHPNILAIYDVGTHDGVPYVVSELLEGDTLRQRMEAPLPPKRAVEYALQVAQGLAAAHEKGIVHRDLKPENLFVTNDGRVKILDFGLAKLEHPAFTSSETDAATLARGTDPGVVLGTVGYMSPEQVRGRAATHCSDIFSFGAVLYEMLTGRRAFKGETAADTMTAILKEEPPDISETQPNVAPALERIVRHCLEKSPEGRFQSARDLAFALEAIQTTPMTGEQPLSRRSLAPRTLLTIAALLGLVLTAGLTFRGLGPRPAPAAARSGTSLAVLPLRVLSGDPATGRGYLGVGIADAIITRLANVRRLRLRATSSILRYATSDAPDPQQAGRTLEVDNVLMGTLQQVDETYRISLQLVRTADGLPIWGHNYDLARRDLLSLQDAVAEEVARALQIQMSAIERERVYRRYTDNAAAYELYLQGRAGLLNYTEATNRAATASFEQALAIDPSYALARAGLAAALARFSTSFAPEADAVRWASRAADEARRALQQDPDLAEAHLALGRAVATAHGGFNWRESLAETAKALELDSNLDLAHLARATAFYHLGLFDQLHEELQQAAEISRSSNLDMESLRLNAAFFRGRFAEARTLGEALLARTDEAAARTRFALASFYLGDAARARELLGGVQRGGQAHSGSLAALAGVLAATGERERARGIVRTVRSGPFADDHHVAYSLGAALAQLGERDDALRFLRQAVEAGFPCYPFFEADPLLQPLRNDAGFQTFMAGLRAAYESARATYSRNPTPSPARSP